MAAPEEKPFFKLNEYSLTALHPMILLAQSGQTVQENLGHFSASFTLDVYGHVTEQMRKDSADRMERFIKGVSGA